MLLQNILKACKSTKEKLSTELTYRPTTEGDDVDSVDSACPFLLFFRQYNLVELKGA